MKKGENTSLLGGFVLSRAGERPVQALGHKDGNDPVQAYGHLDRLGGCSALGGEQEISAVQHLGLC